MVETELRTLSNVLGGSRELALFEAFALRPEAPLSIPEVVEFSRVSWATAHRLIVIWAERGILRPAEKRRKAVLFQLNMESPTVALLAHTAQLAAREMFEADLLDEGFPEYAFTSYGTSASFGGDRGSESYGIQVPSPSLEADALRLSNTTPAITGAKVSLTSTQRSPMGVVA